MPLHLPRPASACIVAVQSDTALSVADGTAGFVVPEWLNGSVVSRVLGRITGSQLGAGTLATLIQLRKSPIGGGADEDLLSTLLNIDAGEPSNLTAATAYVVDATTSQVATGDVLFADTDQIPETTAPQGLSVIMTFE